jgi:hypothetical protein
MLLCSELRASLARLLSACAISRLRCNISAVLRFLRNTAGGWIVHDVLAVRTLREARLTMVACFEEARADLTTGRAMRLSLLTLCSRAGS